MKSPALQFDDFAPDAAAVRDKVIAGGFSVETGPDGAKYTGISQYQVPLWHDRIAELLGCRIIPRLSCFRLNLAGEMPHSWVHSDDICARYASVLYLNPPEQCQGGTAFWHHEGLRIERLPSKEELTRTGWNADWFYAMMSREWKDLQFWKQYASAAMQFNRFVTYPTCFFHSRYPFEGFGKGPEDGRLIWVCFYDKEREA
jgi:hypothetical protein